jgi:D-alanyl-D-alanine carboxypeptidase
MKDLLNGMMLASGNDAAMAVAEAVGGSEEGFADLMNAKAQELNMTHTHFVVPHGMHEDNHYTTASDMAILTEYAMKNPDFAQIVSQASYTMPADNKHSDTWVVKNTNKLLQSDDNYYYKYATGIKTGSTPAAGDCLISSATKGDMNLICLVFKDEFNGYKRWPLSQELFEFGFENFRTLDMQAVLAAAAPVSVPVKNAADDAQTVTLSVQNESASYQTFEKALADKVEAGTLATKITLTSGGDALTAPVNAGDQAGTIDYLDDAGNVLYQGTLVVKESVAAADGTTVQPSVSPGASGTQPAATQAPSGPKNSGVGTLGWILIAVGGVLLVLLILFGVLLMMRKKRYARRRAVRGRRPAQRPGPRR